LFKLNAEAVDYNARVLDLNNFDLKQVIIQQHPSQISFGSEFRSPELVRELLQDHPFWSRLEELLSHGAKFPLTLTEISEDDRRLDLQFHQDRGNHKSASTHHEILEQLITEDVERGFAKQP